MAETKEYFTGGVETSYYPLTYKDNECFRFTDKENTLSEQVIQSNYWREQINLFGQKIDYYVNSFSLSSADLLYGEEPTQKFQPPQRIVMAVNLNDNALMLSKYGLISEDEITAFIHISAFYETYGWNAEPKSGDVFQLWEFGQGRPGGRDGKFYELTEPGLSGSAVNSQVFDDTRNTSVTGADRPYSYSADVESKSIFDYSKTDYNDVYGGYY